MKPPSTIMPMTTDGQGTPIAMMIAATALTSATCEPTERSMPPVMMTKVMAMATIRMGAAWRTMFRMLPSVKKVSLPIEKKIMQARKKMAIDRTCACSPKKSATREPWPRSV
jgi:hypothetical protein